MNKWIAIPVISILIIAIAAGGYFLMQQNNKLTDANSEIVTLENNVSSLQDTVTSKEAEISGLETNVSDMEDVISSLNDNVDQLETDLSASESQVSNLETELDSVNGQVSDLQSDLSAQRNINSSLTSDIKTIKSPRHFSSVQELTDWLDEDDTDTAYQGEGTNRLCYILQVRAMRDGYLMSAILLTSGEGLDAVVIGDEYWFVNPEDDDTQFAGNVDPIPTHPLP